MDSISSMGYEECTPIQEQSIPAIMDGRDLIASAQTGTGKTAAFLLPIIEGITRNSSKEGIKALVIVPTRELAVQIQQNMEGMSYFTSVASVAIYGGGDGNSYTSEKMALQAGVDVVIGTPGRIISHSNMPYVNWSGLKYLVLDEADRMLDMGFHDDIMRIISNLPKKRQNLLFSATMPPKMRDLARKLTANPFEISLAVSKPAEKIVQKAFVIYETQKIPLVVHLLKDVNFRSVIVFCSTKSSVKSLARQLAQAKLSVQEIHSDLDQTQREKILLDFKNKTVTIIVATDILARGIDVEDIDLVVNFDVPRDAEDYIHRIGRTARAEADGLAYTLVNELDQSRLASIERLIERPIEKAVVPEYLGDVPTYAPRQKNKPFKKRFSKNKPHKKA